jgi:rubrerythrin
MDTKLHNREELIKCLVARLKEELMDVETYNTLFESLTDHRLYEDADVIEDIARDEFSHAQAIAEILEEHGHDLSDDQELHALWHKAKHAFRVI